jgi:hypothetical protein
MHQQQDAAHHAQHDRAARQGSAGSKSSANLGVSGFLLRRQFGTSVFYLDNTI